MKNLGILYHLHGLCWNGRQPCYRYSTNQKSNDLISVLAPALSPYNHSITSKCNCFAVGLLSCVKLKELRLKTTEFHSSPSVLLTHSLFAPSTTALLKTAVFLISNRLIALGQIITALTTAQEYRYNTQKLHCFYHADASTVGRSPIWKRANYSDTSVHLTVTVDACVLRPYRSF